MKISHCVSVVWGYVSVSGSMSSEIMRLEFDTKLKNVCWK